MKLTLYNAQNAKTGEVDAPSQFSEPINADLIKSAVHITQNNTRVPYGAFPLAGKQVVAKLSRRRRKWKTSYGIGISRVPRKVVSHSGTRFNWIGALAPGTVGGRRAHPPKAYKITEQKMNKKELQKAMRSAIAATLDKHLVSQNGYRVPASYPFVLDESFESLDKTKEAIKAFEALGFESELERASQKTIRAGHGKGRSRKYRKKSSVLVVVSTKGALDKSVRNIPGVEAVYVGELNIVHLAPSSKPGRAALFTKKALDEMSSKKLFGARQ